MSEARRLERQAGRPRYPNAIHTQTTRVLQSAIRNPRFTFHLRPPFLECRMRESKKFVSNPSND